MNTLLERARKVMPGGVSSPVRAFDSVSGDPPFVASAHGAEVTDTNGKTYVDLVCSWGPLILGHGHPAVIEAVTRTARDGLTFGATCAAEVELAERLLARYPFADKVRFVSSGTEAVMSAVRLARGATGRDVIVKFEGCYHGHSDGLLVKGGSGLATQGLPASAGVPADYTRLTEVLPLDDEEAARKLFAEQGDKIALVLIEPIPANAGLLPQRVEFLQVLRDLTAKHGALLLFDEVISGLRVAPGGATEVLGIEPDLVTLGKIVGGGLPVGAYLAPAKLMDQVAPLGPVYQAGTLSGNPLAMAAGLATLHELDQPGVYAALERTGARLEAGWTAALADSPLDATLCRVGSILWISLQPGTPPLAWHAIDPKAADTYRELHPRVMEAGTWMAPSAFEVAFVSTAHTDEHIDRAVAALGTALGALTVSEGAGPAR